MRRKNGSCLVRKELVSAATRPERKGGEFKRPCHARKEGGTLSGEIFFTLSLGVKGRGGKGGKKSILSLLSWKREEKKDRKEGKFLRLSGQSPKGKGEELPSPPLAIR